MAELIAQRPRRALPSGTFIAFLLLICTVFASVSLVYPGYFGVLAGYHSNTVVQTGNEDINNCIRRSIARTGGVAAWMQRRHNDCPAQPGDDSTGTVLLVYATLILATTAHYWFRANRHARRRGVRPLHPARHPRLHAELQALLGVHLPGRRITFLVDVLHPGVNGMVFGRVRKRAVILSRGLVELCDNGDPQDVEAFRAVVRHELAHLQNRDLDITQIRAARSAALGGTAVTILIWLLTGLNRDALLLGVFTVCCSVEAAVLEALLLSLLPYARTCAGAVLPRRG
jgi:Zn-dependent protease with chaperone function